MSETKHTPGPWATHPKLARVDAFDSGKPFPVCQLLWPTNERSEAETEANARLIAAAPDLLAVCKRIVQEGDALAQSVGLERITEAAGSSIEQARTAIAKATGQP